VNDAHRLHRAVVDRDPRAQEVVTDLYELQPDPLAQRGLVDAVDVLAGDGLLPDRSGHGGLRGGEKPRF